MASRHPRAARVEVADLGAQAHRPGDLIEDLPEETPLSGSSDLAAVLELASFILARSTSALSEAVTIMVIVCSVQRPAGLDVAGKPRHGQIA